MRFLNFITERSFKSSDIPRYFRCVIDIRTDNDKGLTDLSNLELTGVTGISDSGQILYDFLGKGRNAFILMDGEETIKLNKISRIMYDNPHYMLSNNMSALRRIYNKESDRDNRATWHNFADIIVKHLANSNLTDKGFEFYISLDAPGQTISYTNAARNTKVNSIKDAVKVLKRAFKEIVDKKNQDYKKVHIFSKLLEIDDNKLEKILYDSLITIGEVYKTEGEWIIKDNSLKIPRNSYLYILQLVDDDIIQKYEQGDDGFINLRYGKDIERQKEMNNEINKLGINKKYKLKFLSWAKWEETYKKYITRVYS